MTKKKILTGLHFYTNSIRCSLFKMLALPLGVEPRSSVPETNVLSIELQERRHLPIESKITQIKLIRLSFVRSRNN
jgi:hypothetical protein